MFGDKSSTDKGKVYEGTSNGSVIQITYNNQELESVYKVQNAAILSIYVNEACFVTGTLDGYLIVWPAQFPEFLIKTKHDSGDCSVDIFMMLLIFYVGLLMVLLGY